jgi:flagellar biosynthesis/type III secretory pathway chaperone
LAETGNPKWNDSFPAKTPDPVRVAIRIDLVPQRKSFMTATETTLDWEAELGALLDELAGAQEELLAVLTTKREQLARVDLAGLAQTQGREEELIRRLATCQERRADLIAAARKAGLEGDSLGKLAGLASSGRRGKLNEQAKAATAKIRLLRHESLTNWVLAQRALLHVSQLVEIIATGGRLQPTYGERQPVHASGSLVNQEA